MLFVWFLFCNLWTIAVQSFSMSGCSPQTATPPMCPSGYARWRPSSSTTYISSTQFFSQAGTTLDSCKDLCFQTAGCFSAQWRDDGQCFLNRATGSKGLTSAASYTFLRYACCGINMYICEQQNPTISYCPGGEIQWKPILYGYNNVNGDITSRGGQSEASCKQFCLSTAGCASADFDPNTGQCYLNVRGLGMTPSSVSLLSYECCRVADEKWRVVSLGKPASQSSDFDEFYAEYAVDGGYSQVMETQHPCTQTQSGPDNWWSVDLQTPHRVFLVKMWNRGDCCGSRLTPLKVEVLKWDISWIDATSSWVLCDNVTVSAQSWAIYSVSCGDGMVATQVKISLLKSDYLTLCEVEVWGYADVILDTELRLQSSAVTFPVATELPNLIIKANSRSVIECATMCATEFRCRSYRFDSAAFCLLFSDLSGEPVLN